MTNAYNNNKLLKFQILALATFVTSALFMWQRHLGFSLWDEGYLWYGVQRVLLGEVPIRDFMAYDPGRYYWSAALMRLWGDNSIFALRGTLAIIQAIGLFAGLLLISRSLTKQKFLYLILSTVTLTVWMFPLFKIIDISISILLIGVLAHWIQNHKSTDYFLAGVCIGVVAIFGRNHGIYGVVGSLMVILWLRTNQVEGPGLIKGFSLWVAGVIIGFSPILVMSLFITGFADAFLESIRFLFWIGATNLPLAVPWPWRVDFFVPPGVATDVAFVFWIGDLIREVLVGLFFIGILAFGFLSLFWVVRQKILNKQVSPVLVAASFLALPYAHYAYSRPDISHLALGIFPALVGCLVFLVTHPTKVKRTLALILCVASFYVMLVYHPGWAYLNCNHCINTEISGRNIPVDGGTAYDVRLLRGLVDNYAKNGRSFIATPVWPGAYALFERKSPMWEIYALFPRTETFEKAEIERIKKAQPGFALVYDFPIDGRDELRFKNTHPLIYQYIMANFEPANCLSAVPELQIFLPKRSDKENIRTLTPCSNVDGIKIVEASYGLNCNSKLPNSVEAGNATNVLAAACNQRVACTFQITINKLGGDPAIGCSKDFLARYKCRKDGEIFTLKAEDEAQYKTIKMRCPDKVN